jgi:Carboxypeptidase regulatory-like domain/TonB dependent receptor
MGNYSFRLVVRIGFVLAAASPAWLHAQTVSGTILGLVQDPQGGAIGKAEVSARSLDTGAIRKTTSEDNGEYRITSVPAGSYEITITAPGFKTEVRSGIVVTVGADVGVNFAMTVGAVTEKVQVTAEAPQVDTSSSAMGGFVNSATIRELPLNGRDWLQLALLQPGAFISTGEYQTDTSRAQRGNGLAISISGGRTTENVFRIDGLVVNDHANAGPGSSLHVNMGVDSIREFSVLTNNYSAEYGRGASGVVNAITKSGTNQFHGSAYYFHRNSAFDARNFFDGAIIAPFHRHQYGGAIGGPIKKDKTFFFSNYEALTEAKGQSASTDTVSANAHNGILCANPPSCTSTTQVTVDQRVKPYLAFYPIPNGPVNGDAGKFIFASVRLGDEKYVIGKVDHYFSANTTLNVHYSWDNTNVTSPDPYNEKLEGAPTRKINGIVSLQHLFSPTLINNARVGVTRSRAANNLACCIKIPALGDLSLGFIPGHPTGSFTVTGISGTSNFGGIRTDGLNDFHYTAPQAYDDLSWTKGRHSIRTGFAFERVISNIDEENNYNGLWTFSSIKDMLILNPNQFSGLFPGSDALRGSRNSIIGAYIQDDFRIRPNLTLNLGVRYDMSTVIKEVNGKLANLRNLTDSTVTIGDPYYNNPTFKNFAPRIGFAWDPFKNGKTAIRGGVGMFDIIPLPYLFVNLFPRTTPFYRLGFISNPPSSSFPNGAFNLLGLSSLQATRIEPDPARSYKMQWNLNIQRQLTRSMALTVGYVGSVGVHLAHEFYDYDQVPPSLVKIVDSHFVFPIPPGNNLALIQRINPNFGQIRSNDFLGHSSYHSLQTNLIQRLAKGLSYQIAYTYSRSMDNGSSPNGENENLNTIGSPWAFCERCNRGVTDYDIPHNFVLNFQYDIPVFASVKSNAVANTILGGWQVGGIYTRQSGGAYNVKITTDRAFTGSAAVGSSHGGQRPNYLGDLPGCSPREVTTGDIGHLIKVSCFAFPAPGVLGNLGRNVFRMPIFRNLDFSVFKNQNLWGEKLKMQFRAEMFNILNNTNLAANTFTNTFNGTGVLQPTFGTPTAPTANQSRQIQFGLRLLF